MLSILSNLWAREPARITSLLAAIVVFAAAKAGVVIDAQSVGSAVALIVPILLAGESTRRHVVPLKHLVPATIPTDEVNRP